MPRVSARPALDVSPSLRVTGSRVPPGYTDQVKFDDGNPYGVGKVTGESEELTDTDEAALDHLVRRVLHVAGKLTS